MIASSAARSSVSVSSRFVSSNRRAFSSATPMLEARVAMTRSSASLNASASTLSSAQDADHARRPGDGRTEPGRCVCPADLDRAGSFLILDRADPQRSAGRDHRGRQPGAERHQTTIEGGALVQVVRERDQVRGRVVERDEDRLYGEHLPHPFADELDDRVELELARQRLADLVDHRELGRPLVRVRQQPLGLVEQARVRERGAHRGCQRAEQALRVLVERVDLHGLQREDANDPGARQDRHAEPGLRLRAAVDCPEPVALGRCREPKRLPGADDARRQALAERDGAALDSGRPRRSRTGT